MSVLAIIMAAGRSTRMKSNLPKVLHEVCGRPLAQYCLDACFDAGCHRALMVVGHGQELVRERFGGDTRVQFVEQREQLGTGHAVKVCLDALSGHDGDVFILAGDGPMIRAEVLRSLLQAHRDDRADATMATAVLDEPYGFGRIVRDEAGEFLDIVEEIDCTEAQRQIREVFPSYYCVKGPALRWGVSQITNNNRKGEYYLTDLFGILRRAGKRVLAVQAVTEEDVLSANTRVQLADVDAAMQARIQRQHREAGVTIVSSATTYIEAGATIGVDTTIYPFSYVGSGTAIGERCVIGPFATVPRNSVFRDGASLVGAVPEAVLNGGAR